MVFDFCHLAEAGEEKEESHSYNPIRVFAFFANLWDIAKCFALTSNCWKLMTFHIMVTFVNMWPMGIQNNINFRDEQSNVQVSRLLIVYNIIKGKVSSG